jgi:mRNA interferase RelE/StbE
VGYSIIVLRPAQRAIDRLPQLQAQRIFKAIQALATNPRPPGCVKLTDSEDWRIRIGDYRVVYRINDAELIITIISVAHRRDVYR